MSPTEPAAPQLGSQPQNPKPPPCDQCRKRKVKCDIGAPCDRCVQSGLRCTRDIVRKRRGPKKGSGSVIAKLRHEDDRPTTGPNLRYDLPRLEMQLPALNRSQSGSSGLSSPLSSGFAELGPASNPTTPSLTFVVATSAPTSDAPTYPYQAIPLFEQAQHLYTSPAPNENGYVTVNDLAHQIFQNGLLNSPQDLSTLSLQDSSLSTPSVQPSSIDALLNSGANASCGPSPSAVSFGSSHEYSGPKFLFRSNSDLDKVELQVSRVAAEVGMSSYLMSQCVRQYFRHLYPIMPILHETTFRGRLTTPEPLRQDEKCLLLALCAITVLHAAPPSDLSLNAKQRLGRQFLGHCHSIRFNKEWIETAGLTDIISSFFISVSYFELKQPRSHHFYLREAIGMSHEQGFHLESSYSTLSKIQAICYRRTFAVLFVTERGCAILRNKPTSITRFPVVPPEYFDDEDPNILTGFQCLCRLFALLDESFVESWRQNSKLDDNEDTMIQLENIAAIQHSLSIMSFDDVLLTDVQRSDVLITHQWLRLIFWQGSLRQGLISITAEDIFFSYQYPIIVATILCQVMQGLSLESIMVHGLGIVSGPHFWPREIAD